MKCDNETFSSAAGADDSTAWTAYRFGPTDIAVDIDDPDTERWLIGFLAPWFSCKQSDGLGLCVRMRSSLEQYAFLARSEAEKALQPFPCFGLDSQLVFFPGWKEPDGTTVLADKELGCYYRLRNKQVEIFSRPQDKKPRIGLMRVVRELATSCIATQMETLDLHAAAFVVDGRAILLAGEKNVGKTTLLAHALASQCTGLMANDRVIVDIHRLEAYGVPTIVSVRQKTERLFPQLSDLLPRRAFLFHEGEPVATDCLGADGERPLALSPAQFARQLEARIEPRAPIGAIVFPEISPSTQTLSLEPLDPSDAAVFLRRSLYGSRCTERSNTMLQQIANSLPDSSAPDSLLDRLSTAVPLMRCLLGRNAYGRNAENWIKTLPLRTAPFHSILP